MISMAEDDPRCERHQTDVTPKPHDPTLMQRRREAASLLRRIKPEATLKLVRELANIVEFSPPFGHYLRAFTLARAVGTDDEFLADQLEHDSRLDDLERELLFAMRAELALRDLEACLIRTVGERMATFDVGSKPREESA